MKDINFLPEWYKTGRRRQVSYRTQCYVLGGIFVIMIVWNFVTSFSTSKAKAHIIEMKTKQTQAQNVTAKLIELKNEMNLYHNRKGLVDKVDSNLNIASVLAEISYLVNERIVLNKIEFVSEKFEDDESSPQTNAVIRAVQSNLNANQEPPLGDVRFKILLAGVAVDAGDVAGLICKLENSTYFSRVVLSFSKNIELETKRKKSPPQETLSASTGSITGKNEIEEKIQVSKFEISCYLANYKKL